MKDYIVACIGSPLRGDDRIGLLIYDLVGKDTRIIKCEYGLETCITDIVKAGAKGLIIIDAVKVVANNLKPGDIVIASIDEIHDSVVSVSTHNIPLKLTLEILKSESEIRDIVIIGIVVEKTDISLNITPKVLSSGEEIAGILRKVLNKCSKV